MPTAEYEKLFPWVRPDEMLRNGGIRHDVFIVDVRTPAEWAEVHIPGSLNVLLADLPRSIEQVKTLAEGKSILLMCRTQNRAKLGYEQMVKLGVSNCHVLEGGIAKWIEAKRPVVQGQKTVSLDRQVRMASGILIVVGALLGFLMHPWWHVLSAGVGAGLLYSGIMDSCMMALLLAKCPWNRTSPSLR